VRQGESLYFWRLGFYPTYDADAVELGLREVLNESAVHSAVGYELFGPYDVLLRVWLPVAVKFDAFQDALIDRLARANLNMCDPFQVARPVRHWLFPHDANGLIVPTDDALAELDDPFLISAIESGEVDADRFATLSKVDRLVAPFRDHAETTDSSDPGTKFAVVVSGDPRLTTSQHQQFETTLTKLLDQAERLEQKSLYSGSGFGHFLVMGMVKGHPLSILKDDLLEPITLANIAAVYGARTYTHVSGRADYVFIQESLIDTVTTHDTLDEESRRPEAPPREEPAVGSLFAGRFKIEREIGRGGFSEVFEVFDEVEQATRALKVFKSIRASEQIRREIAYLRKVEDPHVMRVYWADRTPEGRWYLVSEYVEGVPLSEIIDDHKVSVEDALAIGEELLMALEAIHPNETRIRQLKEGDLTEEQFAELQELQDAGFVHRDVKPGNIILGARGVKLLDFNIASRAGAAVHTRSGTPPYQPPEGDLAVWDVTADLFAAGVVLYELITGEHPYEGELPRSDREPRDPRNFRPDLPGPVAAFLTRASAPNKAARYSSAREMRRALAVARRETDMDTRAGPREFGSRLREERDRRGYSASELASRAGLTEKVLLNIEAGENSPTLTQARTLAQVLNMSLARLLGKDTK
jgi:serine/threonine protein kinase